MLLRPEYCREAPSEQNMLDILGGSWVSALPEAKGLRAGATAHYEIDRRVGWANSALPNGLKGMSVLELGPLEAYHTYLLQQFGTAQITSVEANNLSFLKCLIVKELLHLDASFLYGDCTKYLETVDKRFDLAWVSGLLYHHTDPLYLLDLLQNVTDTLFIHTHYFVPEVILSNPAFARFFDPSRNMTVERRGYRAEYFHRNYLEERSGVFSGGPDDFSYWLKQEDIFGFLRAAGFTSITIGKDHPHNPNGPAMYFLARR